MYLRRVAGRQVRPVREPHALVDELLRCYRLVPGGNKLRSLHGVLLPSRFVRQLRKMEHVPATRLHFHPVVSSRPCGEAPGGASTAFEWATQVGATPRVTFRALLRSGTVSGLIVDPLRPR